MPMVKRTFDKSLAATADVTAADITIIVLDGGKPDKGLDKQGCNHIETEAVPLIGALEAFAAGTSRLLYLTGSGTVHKAGAVNRLVELYNLTRLPVSLGDNPECAGKPRFERCKLPNVLHRPAAPLWSVLLDRGHVARLLKYYELYPDLDVDDQELLARVIGLFATDTTGLCKRPKQRTPRKDNGG